MKYLATFSLCILPTIISGNFNVDLNTYKPQPKTSWAKQAFKDIYTAGLLTTRQIKYAAEAGFKAIISVPNTTAIVDMGNGEYVPTSNEAKALAESLGMRFEVILEPGTLFTVWSSVEAVNKMTRVMKRTSQRPLLVHCVVSYTATFELLASLAQQSAQDPNFTPQVKANDIFRIGAEIGLDYTFVPSAVATIRNVTGDRKNRTATYGSPYGPYWSMMRVVDWVLVGGQITDTDISALMPSDEVKTVVNFRAGPVSAGTKQPSKGEVNLLNINEKLRTTDGRQLDANLRNNRLNPTLPNTYIVVNSTKNFEAMNPLEFGDNEGYNEALEKQRVESLNFTYVHLPMGDYTPYGMNAATYRMYKPAITRVMNNNINTSHYTVFHCKTGTTAGVMVFLALAEKHNWTADHTIDQLGRKMGVHVQKGSPEDLTIREVIDGDTSRATSAGFAVSCFAVNLVVALRSLFS